MELSRDNGTTIMPFPRQHGATPDFTQGDSCAWGDSHAWNTGNSHHSWRLGATFGCMFTITSVANDLLNDALGLDNEPSALAPRAHVRYGQWARYKLTTWDYKNPYKIAKFNGVYLKVCRANSAESFNRKIIGEQVEFFSFKHSQIGFQNLSFPLKIYLHC